MKDFLCAIDNLPKLIKIILCIPALDIIWAIYRIIKGVTENNALLVVIGILWIVPGSVFGWIFDIITVILYGHPKLTNV